jgi:2-methylcitrate dehydratase PrpD
MLPIPLDRRVDGTLEWLEAFDLSRHPEVERKARLLLLDTIACATAGLASPEVSALVESLAAREPGGVRWPGMRHSLGPTNAAYAGAMGACWHEACEGLARAHGRPGLHAIPAALSLAIATGATLGQLLDAIVWGYELGGRFGEAMRIRPGMHVDGSWGALASAASAARIGGGGADQVRTAMALAACQIPASLYLPVRMGSNARNTYCAHASAMGIFYGTTARAGCSAPAGAFLEAARIVVGDPERDAWPWAAEEFLLLQGYLKPFAAVRHVHYPVQCALEWRRIGIDPRSIDAITLRTYPEALTYCGNRAPQAAIQAQFSLSYGTAYALRYGELGPEAYDVGALGDALQQRLEAMIVLEADPGMTGRGAQLTVRAGGAEQTCRVDSVLGDPDQPMGDGHVAAKALRYMTPHLGEAGATAVVQGVMQGHPETPLETAAD